MADNWIGYIPVPMWDGEKWRPTDHRDRYFVPPYGKPIDRPGVFDSYREMDWPEGFDPAVLTPPLFNLEQHVHISWGQEKGHGNITRIYLRGGAYTELDVRDGLLPFVLARYAIPPTYEATWRGHNRSFSERQIVT